MSTGTSGVHSPANGTSSATANHGADRPKQEGATVDDFGLATTAASRPVDVNDDDSETFHDAEDTNTDTHSAQGQQTDPQSPDRESSTAKQGRDDISNGDNTDIHNDGKDGKDGKYDKDDNDGNDDHKPVDHKPVDHKPVDHKPINHKPIDHKPIDHKPIDHKPTVDTKTPTTSPRSTRDFSKSPILIKDQRASKPAVSEWSHQQLAPKEDAEDAAGEEAQWQAMPALGEFDIYDDDGRIVAKALTATDAADAADKRRMARTNTKGYTRIQLDEDAQSATSMDEDTSYLFNRPHQRTDSGSDQFDAADGDDDDADLRDAATQLENTKDLLTDGQKIAYVGLVRLTMHKMQRALEDVESSKATKKELIKSLESMELWGQMMMVRLYAHMDIDNAEQLMIEQLADHGVQPADLVPPLMQNAHIKNPLADPKADAADPDSSISDKAISVRSRDSVAAEEPTPSLKDVAPGEEVPELQQDLPTTENLDLDIRWTVLCDLFLLLVSNGSYDARSRRLLERVASSLQISWLQICRFEKRVIDALEGQEQTEIEDVDESETMEARRKKALKQKYMYMGLATVGGGLVIGLTAGLLAPAIGAGLAAGFTTIGITGTTGFLGGVGGAALITSIGITTGGAIAVRASDRRTGHVKTFEYRPLHDNKRLNLILTVSGWMTGKVDDVRLPYSTVDPIMGDIYSLLWEPEMLQSMGDTINILANEALTQTVQQVLGSTILVALMASIQLPIVLTKLSYLIDNPWSVSLDRANAAGLILADSLIQHHLGKRPITLLGFSLGARVIFSCLKELSARGAYGIVQNVYLFGSPIVVKKDEYIRARSIIAGRFVNGYVSHDWILGYLFRATSGGLGRVSGLAPVEGVPGLENIDVGPLVNGHMAYRQAMPRLLREVGWEVESDEFTEIEDPDPDNHEQRQRELIQEIDEARKQAEEKHQTRRFAFFKRGALAEKRPWENYKSKPSSHRKDSLAEGQTADEPNVLFDIDAIRRELESEMIEVRELDSTLPPLQITSRKDGEKHVEYLRLPPEVRLSKDEIARMKLPARPDEIDVNIAAARPSLSPRRSSSITPSSHPSPLPSPRQAPSKVEEEVQFLPKELVSTLPPLSLPPSASNATFTSPPSPSKSPLPAHATPAEPPSDTDEAAPTISSQTKLSSPINTFDFAHNAWANDDNFGHDKEIKMTFE
ncbi:hypothetical protein DV736_g1008, partial [Chaetothyriales sp. CBS 134916]